MNKDIIWVSSFPKSGNTWVRFILAHILYAKPFENSNVVEKLVPDIHKKQFNPDSSISVSGKFFVKTHFAFQEKMPFYNRTAGFIYIVRDPVKVFTSAMRYVGRDDGEKVAKAGQVFAYSGTVNGYERLGFGSWPEHVRSWLSQASKFPHLVIRYEDLDDNFERTVQNIIRFFGMDPARVDIDLIKERTSKSKMREMELREIENNTQGFFYSESKARKKITDVVSNTFIGDDNNKVVVEPDSETIARIRERFKPVLKNFNYDT